MNAVMGNGNGFTGYEYKEVSVHRDMGGVYADGYPNFGWEIDGSASPIFGLSTTHLRFKRDRKIVNKAELTRLQHQFESCASAIEKLEGSKTTRASIAAFSLGIVGSAFMAGSVFAFLANNTILCTVLAVPAFIGWILPYFAYLHLTAKRIEEVRPLVEHQYDCIYEVCEKAHGLLAV